MRSLVRGLRDCDAVAGNFYRQIVYFAHDATKLRCMLARAHNMALTRRAPAVVGEKPGLHPGIKGACWEQTSKNIGAVHDCKITAAAALRHQATIFANVRFGSSAACVEINLNRLLVAPDANCDLG